MKYSKTTLMELSHRYGKILKKCALLNAALLMGAAISTQALAGVGTGTQHDTWVSENHDYTNASFSGRAGVDADSEINTRGGAVYVKNSNVTFNGTTEFSNNVMIDGSSDPDGWGGAVYSDNAGKSINFNGATTFSGNKASAGGVIIHFGGSILFNDTATFTNNVGNSGGAINNYAPITFKKKATFTGNTALTGGAALYNGGAITFDDDAEFTSNSSTDYAGAIYNNGDIIFNKKATFSNNTAAGAKQDIENGMSISTITFNGETTLDGGIVNNGGATVNFGAASILHTENNTNEIINGAGTVHFEDGSKLRAKLNNSTALISAGTVTGTTALVVVDYTEDGVLNLFSADPGADFELTAYNGLYDITDNEDGTYLVEKKPEEEVAEELEEGDGEAGSGMSAETSKALAAMTAGSTDHPVLAALSEALQTGDIAAAEKGAKALAPTSSAQVLAISQGVVDMLADVATGRAKAAGVAGGDTFKGGAMWVQGLYNHAKQGANADTTGFRANTRGVAMGMDAKLSDAMTVGLGYAYTNTKADSFGRDTDVDGHNAFLYGQYQPNQWYANWLMSYGYGKYEEEKAPMGIKMKAKYHVNSYAARLTSGYELDNGFALEGGLRYLLVDQESYNDGAQRIKSDKNDVWTGMAGIRYAQSFAGDKVTWTPHANLAMTYDFVSDGPDSNVQVLGGGNYRIHGEKLHRFGVEGGAGLTMTVGAWDLSADYRGAYRKNFQSHAGMLKAKFNF